MPTRLCRGRLFPFGRPVAARPRRGVARGGPAAAAERLEGRVLLSAAGRVGSEELSGPDAAPVPVDLPSLDVDRRDYAADAVLVRFREGGPADPAALARRGRELMAGSGLWLVDLREGRDVRAARAAWARRPDVRYAAFDHRVTLGGTAGPASAAEAAFAADTAFAADDPAYADGRLWGLTRIDVAAAWRTTAGSAGTVVAVIDSGIDYTHPDLRANMWVNVGEIAGNGKDDDGNGYVDDVHGYDFANGDGDPADDDGHGTHVAGTIAASADGAGVVGVAPGVRLMALKFLDASGNGRLSAAVSALNYAVAMWAQVSNNSWSGGGFHRGLHDAIRAAAAKGHVFVAAAGNRGDDNDAVATYPANNASDNVVSVAATDRNDRVASFSNYGATAVDLAAPGVSILSTVPAALDDDGTRDGYAYFGGTSMAAPHVTGAIALAWAANPGLSYRQVIDRVLSSVDPVAGLVGRTFTGGRLNAAAAVAAAIGGTTGSPSGGEGDGHAAATAGDGFESGGFYGGTGWAEAAWRVAGDAAVAARGGSAGNAFHARLRGSGRLTRSADLSGATGATLRFDAKVGGFEAGDRARVLASADGSTWTRVAAFSAADGGPYRTYQVDLSAFAGGSRVRLAFVVRTDDADDRLFVDAVEVAGTAPASGADSSAAGVPEAAVPVTGGSVTGDVRERPPTADGAGPFSPADGPGPARRSGRLAERPSPPADLASSAGPAPPRAAAAAADRLDRLDRLFAGRLVDDLLDA